MSKERIRYIDVARGIAIILMVLGHILETETVGRDLIFSFHMPLFLIVSGYFFSERGDFKTVFAKTLVKLVIPAWIILSLADFINFLRWNTEISSLLSSCIHKCVLFYSWRNDGYGILWDYPYGTGVMWFISLIFLVRLFYFTVNKMTKGSIYENLAVSGLLALLGYYISQNLSYWLPWSFDVALSSTIFFGIGHFLKKYSGKMEKVYTNRILMGCFFLGWIWLTLEFRSIELAMRTYPQGFTSYITAVLGTVTALAVSYHCEKKLHFLPKILIWFGENSFYVLMAHHLESSVIDYGQLWNSRLLLFVVKLLIVFVLACMIKFVVDKISLLLEMAKSRRMSNE